MTFVQKIETETVFFLILGALVGYFFITQTRLNQQQFHTISDLSANAAYPTLTPSPTVFTPEITTTSQISADGMKKVTVKGTKNADQTTTYSVETADGDGNNTQPILTRQLNTNESIIIPFNTWSPDKNYFFVKEVMATGSAVMVFKGNEEAFSDGEQFHDLTDAFTNRNTGYNLEEATGWAANNLIIINTTDKNNEKGPSYWFEASSKAVIQLSTRF